MTEPTEADRKRARKWVEENHLCSNYECCTDCREAFLAGLAAGRAEERERCLAIAARYSGDGYPYTATVGDDIAAAIRSGRPAGKGGVTR